MLSCGWYAEETSADSADALSVVICKVQCHITALVCVGCTLKVSLLLDVSSAVVSL